MAVGHADRRRGEDAAAERPFNDGDLVRIRNSSRTGEVRFCGAASFAKSRVVAGLRLHRKRTSSDCDGEYKGERYFRCTPGYGLYALVEDVRGLRPRARAHRRLHTATYG